MKFLSDLFKGVGGTSWELARVMSAWALLSFSFAFLYALVRLGKVPDWSNLGIGYSAVLIGAGAYIGIKDIARANAAATTSAAATAADGSTTTTTTAGPTAVTVTAPPKAAGGETP